MLASEFNLKFNSKFIVSKSPINMASDPYTGEVCIFYDNDITVKFKGKGMIRVRVRVRVRFGLRYG